MTTPSVEDLERASAAVGQLIARLAPDQWNAPTPCSEWSVRDVVNHLVVMNWVFVALLDGDPMPERGADHLGDDPMGAYRVSAAALHDAFRRPGVLERSFAGPLGSATGAERLMIRLYDLLTHGWDIAQAIGTSADLPDDLAQQALVFARDQVSTQSRAGRFGEPQPAGDTASAIEQLAAFLGRRAR
jgi:uncharacterized protein (TIGR03086 family)